MSADYNELLLTETEGNSMFCAPETVDVSQGKAEASKNQESKKRKNRANFIRKYMKYFINFLKNIKFNSAHNVIHKTFAVFGCANVACSRDGARDFFVIHR